jgi:hypothetical protein
MGNIDLPINKGLRLGLIGSLILVKIYLQVILFKLSKLEEFQNNE